MTEQLNWTELSIYYIFSLWTLQTLWYDCVLCLLLNPGHCWWGFRLCRSCGILGHRPGVHCHSCRWRVSSLLRKQSLERVSCPLGLQEEALRNLGCCCLPFTHWGFFFMQPCPLSSLCHVPSARLTHTGWVLSRRSKPRCTWDSPRDFEIILSPMHHFGPVKSDSQGPGVG